jgi:hypothetical protein
MQGLVGCNKLIKSVDVLVAKMRAAIAGGRASLLQDENSAIGQYKRAVMLISNASAILPSWTRQRYSASRVLIQSIDNGRASTTRFLVLVLSCSVFSS